MLALSVFSWRTSVGPAAGAPWRGMGIVVLDYDPRWPEQFETLRAFVWAVDPSGRHVVHHAVITL